MAIVLKGPGQAVTKPRSRFGKTESIEYIGVVSKITQQWDDVKMVRLEDGNTVKVTDPNDEVQPETTYRFHGNWKDHHKYGMQFHAESFAADAPITQRGVIKYLAANCDNIGEQTARRIWDTFGNKSLDIVQHQPEALEKAGILPLDKAKEAAECLKHETGTMRTKIDLLGLFKGYGLGERAIQDCLLTWGAKAAQVVRRDPFKMMVAQVRGAGYLRCDRLYQELGLPVRRLKRQMLKLWYDLQTDYSGHTWFPIERTKDITPKAVELGIRAKWLVVKEVGGRKWITERRKAAAESALAAHLTRLASWKPSIGSQVRTNWPALDSIEGISDHQREEAAKALAGPVAVLAGSPGTGKTYVAAAIIRAAKRLGLKIQVCAPTGKAAVRVKESLFTSAGVSIDAMTIHKMCGLIGGSDEELGFACTGLHEGIVIVDETSMVDVPLMATLLSQCRTGTHLLFLGDPYQLPPVGHGAPLRDMLQSELVSKGELTEIQRNAGQIVKACKSIKEGKTFYVSEKYNPETGDNLRMIESADNADTVACVLRLLEIVPRYDFHPVWDTQILVAVNERGPCSRVALNKLLQQKLNPNGITIDKHPFRVGDKIICLKNNKVKHVALRSGADHVATNYIDQAVETDDGYESEAYVANGELGKVIAVSRNQTIAAFNSPPRTVRILHGTTKEPAKETVTSNDLAPDEKEPEAESNGLQYSLGFAITTHKCQGSDSPCIIVVVDPLARSICTREHVYTSISRAKKLCILVGQRKVADQFCSRVALDKRKTHLVHLLEGGA